MIIGLGGEAPLANDLLESWSVHPAVLLVLATAGAAYVRGRAASWSGRDLAFAGGVGAVALALVSPLDSLAGELASAHMVQHVLLIAVAGPLLAWSAPGPSLIRGMPTVVRRQVTTIRRGFGIDAQRLRRLRSPAARWLLFVVLLWLWHAAVLYDAALHIEAVHIVQHGSFLGAAFLVWTAVLGPKRSRVERGAGVLLVFTLALQNVFLSALLTFSNEPWYDYATTARWGLDPLTDQHVAGVIMWVPVGFVHASIGLALLLAWVRETGGPDLTVDEGGMANGVGG